MTTESPIGTLTLPGGAPLVDPQGNLWALADGPAPAAILRNGEHFSGWYGVKLVADWPYLCALSDADDGHWCRCDPVNGLVTLDADGPPPLDAEPVPPVPSAPPATPAPPAPAAPTTDPIAVAIKGVADQVAANASSIATTPRSEYHALLCYALANPAFVSDGAAAKAADAAMAALDERYPAAR